MTTSEKLSQTGSLQTFDKVEVPSQFVLPMEPVAENEAIVIVGKARFTVLTSRMIRCEYNPSGTFEDRASMAFWFRKQAVPQFVVKKTEKTLEIITDYCHLTYTDGKTFTAENLQITLLKTEKIWHYGDENFTNLGGTLRTLDGVNGSRPLPDGLMSRSGWSVIDDSKTLVFNDKCWLIERGTEEELSIKKDIYFFGYGSSYQKCLSDFCKVCGPIPIIPRYFLGNWWSRYWAYSEKELVELISDFKKKEFPLSICIIDMDWHIVKNEHTNGWTGYTWDKKLFPDHRKFLKWFHEQGIRTALNLHPADGVHSHEEMYEEFAKHMGIDPESKLPIEFDIADPKFTKGYFELLHNPHEDAGIDFWWMDWQQGTKTKIKNLDPLWWLNHLHYHDMSRNGKTRPVIFSRWGEWGNHRYPIGFSGDTHVSWKSLSYQPYFTATASNVGYCYWSHDIGGHYHGEEDNELYMRWLQFGVFSPILRIHATKNKFQDRRPWLHGEEFESTSRNYMQLRHALIPYIYTMYHKTSTECLPLIRPMYWDHAEKDEAYGCTGQYYFGTELIVAPFTTSMDPNVRVSKKPVWLPEGDWYNFFTGEYHKGGRFMTAYGSIKETPVFAKAGAIIPMNPKSGSGDTGNSSEIELSLFAGADGAFTLYEDDGLTLEYKKGEFATTSISQSWIDNKLSCIIDGAQGVTKLLPQQRSWKIIVNGIKNPDSISIAVGNKKQLVTDHSYDESRESVCFTIKDISITEKIEVVVEVKSESILSRRNRTEEKLSCLIRNFKLSTYYKTAVQEIIEKDLPVEQTIKQIAPFMTKEQLMLMAEIITGAGYAFVNTEGPGYFLCWNPEQNKTNTYSFKSDWHSHVSSGVIPEFLYVGLNRREASQQNQLWIGESFFASVCLGDAVNGVVNTAE